MWVALGCVRYRQCWQRRAYFLPSILAACLTITMLTLLERAIKSREVNRSSRVARSAYTRADQGMCLMQSRTKDCLGCVCASYLSVFDIWIIRHPNTLKSSLTSHYSLNRLLVNSHSYCKQETSNNNNNKEALTAFLNRLFVVTTGVSNFRI